MIKSIPKEVEPSTSMVAGTDIAEKESPVDEFFRRYKRKPPKFKRVKRGLADPDISEDPDLFPAKLMQSFGTTDMDLTNSLFSQVINTVPWSKPDAKNSNYVVSALHGINPRDELDVGCPSFDVLVFVVITYS